MSDAIPDDMPGGMSDDMPGGMSDDMPDGMSDSLPTPEVRSQLIGLQIFPAQLPPT